MRRVADGQALGNLEDDVAGLDAVLVERLPNVLDKIVGLEGVG